MQVILCEWSFCGRVAVRWNREERICESGEGFLGGYDLADRDIQDGGTI